MTKKTKIIYFSILFIQSLIIAFLLLHIYHKQNVISINPLKKDGLIFPISSPKLKYFYEPKPNSIRTDHPDWLPYTATNTINTDRLNERFDYSTAKAPDTYRIITIGDSFTFGAFVNTADNWTEKLEDLFQTTNFCNGKKVEVINLGGPAYDLEYAVARLKLRGIKYDPDIVIWFVKNDDFAIINEIMKPTMDKHEKEFDAKLSLYSTDYSWLNMAIKEVNEKYGEETILNRQIEIVKSMADIFKKKLVFITFPQTQMKYRKILSNFLNSRPQTYLYDKLPDIYLPNMSSARLRDGHPSVEGHQLIATSVFEYLKQNTSILCR